MISRRRIQLARLFVFGNMIASVDPATYLTHQFPPANNLCFAHVGDPVGIDTLVLNSNRKFSA